MNASLREGMPVYDASGSELGTVKEVRGQYFKVDASMQPDYWLRADACRSEGGRLVVMDAAERYEDIDEFERRETTGTAARGATDAEQAGGRARTEGAETLELREEQLRVDKEREQVGEVQVGKRVTERTETVNVPVQEERVVIERQPVNERAEGGEIRESDQTIEVPVERERAVAAKETVVREEVDVRKESTERTQPVQGTVRKEELVVEGEGDVVEGGRNPNAPGTGESQREQTRRG